MSSRIVEKLLILQEKGQGLLLRVYNLKRDLNDANSDLSFLKEKAFVSLVKALPTPKAKAALKSFIPNPKQAEEITKTRQKIRKHLFVPYETLADVTELCCVHIPELMAEVANTAGLDLDTARTPELTSTFLDLVVTYCSLLILTGAANVSVSSPPN